MKRIPSSLTASPLQRCAALLTCLAVVVFFSACDLGVENPGEIEDTDLDTPAAIVPMVNGVKGAFGYGATIPGGGGLFTSGALLTDEAVHVGTWQPVRLNSDGISINTEPENQSRWSWPQEARAFAEEAIERIGEMVEDPQSNQHVATVTLYAGFSNRVLGDAFCHAVIDGGPLEDYTVFHERAEGFFTDAIAVAQAAGNDDEVIAAYGGRAQARVMLGDWNGALDDAAMVDTDFSYDQVFSDNSSREHNGVHNWVTRGDNGEQVSIWGTPFAEWGTEVNGELDTDGDPRAPFRVVMTEDDDGNEVVATGGDNRRPLYYAEKYDSRNSPISIVKGTEMRLIEAEAALLDGDIPGMVDAIDEVRAHHGLDPVDDVPGSETEAWDLLMQEKGLELWLEGRRLPDLRRWAENPGFVNIDVVRQEAAGEPADADEPVNVLDVEDLCLLVSSDEYNSNPNL